MLQPTKSPGGDIAAEDPSDVAPPEVEFERDMVPLLKKHCVKCHAAGARKGDFNFDTREGLLATGAVLSRKSTESRLIMRLTTRDAETRMPPTGAALNEEAIATFKNWIDQGLDWKADYKFEKTDE